MQIVKSSCHDHWANTQQYMLLLVYIIMKIIFFTIVERNIGTCTSEISFVGVIHKFSWWRKRETFLDQPSREKMCFKESEKTWKWWLASRIITIEFSLLCSSPSAWPCFLKLMSLLFPFPLYMCTLDTKHTSLLAFHL